MKKPTISTNVGEYVMIKDRPCKIIEISDIKHGKDHGKKLVRGNDIFTGIIHEDVIQKKQLAYPQLAYEEYTLTFIDDDGNTELSPIYSLRCVCYKADGQECCCGYVYGEDDRDDIKIMDVSLREKIINAKKKRCNIIVTTVFWQTEETIISFVAE